MKSSFIFYILLFIKSLSFAQTSETYIVEMLQKGMLDKAIKDVEMADLKPASYAFYKGIIYHAKYNADSAVVYLQEAYRSDIRTDEVKIKLAQALLWKKNFKDSKPLLDQVQDKSSLDYLKTKALLFEILNNFNKALELYNNVIAREELPYGTMEKKAILLSWMKKFDESIDLLDDIIKTEIVSEPLRIRSLIHKARVISWKKDFEKAIDILNLVLKRDPKNTRARIVKAEILEWQGKYKDAKDLYKDVLVIDPEHDEAKWKLGKLLWVK